MTKAAATTGVGPTATVALEHYFPKDRRIIDDDLAARILPFGIRALVWLLRPSPARDWIVRTYERIAPGIWGGVLCRKRYIDDKLTESAGQIDAVVNLGAGWDTRVYRLPALAALPVWELDQPQNIDAKRARLRKLFGDVPAHVKLVAIDFDREALGAVLAAHGYSPGMRTFFIWEAVTQYLTESGFRATMELLAGAAPGSRLAFTYIRQDLIKGRVLYGQERIHNRYVVRDRSWLFGLDPAEVANLLGTYGWRPVEHLGYEELAESYVKRAGRQLSSTPIERVVYTVKLR